MPFFTCSNRSLIFPSESPDTPEMSSVPATANIGSPRVPAAAWASSVFPHPGGPWRRQPRGGDRPRCSSNSGRSSWWVV